MELFECTRLRANISKRQCEINRNGLKGRGVSMAPIATCQGCAGLGSLAHVTLPVEETNVKKTLKHIYCGHKGCYVIVKKEGDFCKKHQGLEDQVAAGTVQADHPEEKSEMVAEAGAGQQDQNHSVEANEKAEADHVADAGKLIESCGDCSPDGDCQIVKEIGRCICDGKPYTALSADAEISPVTTHPPQEHADPLALLSFPATEGTKGLAALLRAPAPLPVGLFIPFASDELAALEESEVTPEVIREFVIMGLEGKLQPVTA